ncbi:MAG: cysteine desulfurase [Armatimonadetes bacterium]|nr:cysteine desulfurase [Armatimonadota bacterium]
MSGFDRTRYFDNAATTPLDPRVKEAMEPWMDEGFGNANSIHAWGRLARQAVEKAREQVAELLGAADPSQVLFTSGATESNNWVLCGAVLDCAKVSPFEHVSVRDTVEAWCKDPYLGHEGWTVTPRKTKLASVMAVCNETGAVLAHPMCGGKNHSDATQALGKVPWQVGELDFASFSSHKLYGPKGVGGLYLRDPDSIKPFLRGGGQEIGLRGGTLNVAGIVGFGAAAALAQEQMAEDRAHAQVLRQAVLDENPDAKCNDAPDQSPFVLSLTFPGLTGESLVVEADANGFAISSGPACSSGKTKPSPVLMAAGLTEDEARATVRISFGRTNTLDAARQLGETLRLSAQSLALLG